jgi:hypothetical protein
LRFDNYEDGSFFITYDSHERNQGKTLFIVNEQTPFFIKNVRGMFNEEIKTLRVRARGIHAHRKTLKIVKFRLFRK